MANSKEFLSILKLMPTLELGDIVEFPRVFYNHYGIYVGNGNVIHVTSAETTINFCGKKLSCSGISSGSTRKPVAKGIVAQQNLLDIAENFKAKKNNYFDGKHSPLSPKKIVKKARSMLDKEFNYHLRRKNCKHFATWCRYEREDCKKTNCFCLDSCSPSIQVATPDTSNSV